MGLLDGLRTRRLIKAVSERGSFSEDELEEILALGDAAIIGMYKAERDGHLRLKGNRTIVRLLAESGDLGRTALRQLLADPGFAIRQCGLFVLADIARALGTVGDKKGAMSLLWALRNMSLARKIGGDIAWALGALGSIEAVEPLISLLEFLAAQSHLTMEERRAGTGAIEALGTIGDARATKPLLTVLRRNCFPEWSSAAAAALGQIRQPSAEPLVHALTSGSPVPAEAFRNCTSTVAPALLEELKNGYWVARKKAADMLGSIGDAKVVPALVPLLDDDEMEVRGAAARALKEIGGEDAARALQQVQRKNSYGQRRWIWSGEQQAWSGVACSADGERIVCVAYRRGPVYASTDGGATWTERKIGNFAAVASSANGLRLVVAEHGGYLFASGDFGEKWMQGGTEQYWRKVTCSVDGARLAAVSGGSVSRCAILDERGLIYTSQDFGKTWSERASRENWVAIASSSDGAKLVAVARHGFLYTSTDAGETWIQRGSKESWTDVASSADGAKLVAVVGGGFIYTSTDSGETWTQGTKCGPWSCVACSEDGAIVLAAQDPGFISLSTDSGATWITQMYTSGSHWVGVSLSATGDKAVAVTRASTSCGSDGRILVSNGSLALR